MFVNKVKKSKFVHCKENILILFDHTEPVIRGGLFDGRSVFPKDIIERKQYQHIALIMTILIWFSDKNHHNLHIFKILHTYRTH